MDSGGVIKAAGPAVRLLGGSTRRDILPEVVAVRVWHREVGRRD